MRSDVALVQLNVMRHRLAKQQYKTLKGQILAGDSAGAMRGLATILMREGGDGHKSRNSAPE